MIVTDKFVFAHVIKTGGVFVRQLIDRTVSTGLVKLVNAGDWHVSIDTNKKMIGDLPIITTRRSPSQWYQSWCNWCYSTKHIGIDNIIFKVLSDDYTLPNNEIISRCLNPSLSHFKEMESRLSKRLYVVDSLPEMNSGFTLEWRDLECDFYTFLKVRVLSKNYFDVVLDGAKPDLSNIHWMNIDKLTDDYLSFLDSIGLEYNEYFTTLIKAVRPLNETNLMLKQSNKLSKDAEDEIDRISISYSNKYGV